MLIVDVFVVPKLDAHEQLESNSVSLLKGFVIRQTAVEQRRYFWVTYQVGRLMIERLADGLKRVRPHGVGVLADLDS